MTRPANPYDRYSAEGEAWERATRRAEQAQALLLARREQLAAAACLLMPDHGIGVPVARLAVQAGMPVRAARAIYNAGADVALDAVRVAWHDVIDRSAPVPGDRPAEFVARVIHALRMVRGAERIAQAMVCGALHWQREAVAEAEAFLAFALGGGLGDTLAPAGPVLPAAGFAAVGAPLLALARLAAADTRPVDAAAARIAAMLLPAIDAAIAEAAAAPPAPAPAPCPADAPDAPSPDVSPEASPEASPDASPAPGDGTLDPRQPDGRRPALTEPLAQPPAQPSVPPLAAVPAGPAARPSLPADRAPNLTPSRPPSRDGLHLRGPPARAA